MAPRAGCCFRLADRQRQLVRGDDHEATQATLAALADLYEAWGKPEKAAEYRALLREAEEAGASD